MKFYENENITIYNADILDPQLFNEAFIDLIVTSPPYNVDLVYDKSSDDMSYEEYLEFSARWLTNVLCWSKEGARLCLNIPLDKNRGGLQPVYADLVRIAKEVGWRYQSTIVWAEKNISKRTAWGSWMSASAPYVIAPVEMIALFYKKQWKKPYKGKSDITKEEFMAWTNGLWEFNGESKKRIGHPAPFPRELPRRCIKLFSYVGDLVFDPFMGSGTTLIEAVLHERKAVGVDISPNYCELAKKRIQKELQLFV